jgi:hypothetical protein
MGSHLDYTVANSRQCLCPCDIDGDGDCDVVTADYSYTGVDSILTVLLNDGAGNLAAAAQYVVGGNPYDLVAVDLDGDSDLDFATANSADSSLTLLFNQGDGTLDDVTTIDMGNRPEAIAVLDVEADGDLDLAVACNEETGPTLLLNNGDGTFAAGVSVDTSAQMANGVAAADINGDGLSDLVVCSGSIFAVYEAVGTGKYVRTQESVSAGFSGLINVADFDANGWPDVALEQYHAGNISLRFNSNGTLGPEQLVAVGGHPADLAAADFDGDRDIDLAVAGVPDGHITLLENDGGGGFEVHAAYPCGNCPSTVAALDLDGDGDLDLASGECNGWVHTFENLGDPTFMEDDESELPTFSLSQNYPNPFNPSTVIECSLPARNRVNLAIFNVLGQKVRTLIDAERQAGPLRVTWDGLDDRGKPAATGVYFYRFRAGDQARAKKMLLVR